MEENRLAKVCVEGGKVERHRQSLATEVEIRVAKGCGGTHMWPEAGCPGAGQPENKDQKRESIVLRTYIVGGIG